MKERIKGLIAGIFIGIMIAATTVVASNTVVKKDLHYNDIKITMNGEEIRPTDANGNYVEPFIIDGTTYLPVRGVANALELDVEWDGTTNTVKLSDHDFAGKTDVETFVYLFGSDVETNIEESMANTGYNCEVTITAQGNTIIFEEKLKDIDNLSTAEKEDLQKYLDNKKSAMEESFKGLKEEVGSLDEIIVNICEADGDIIATLNIEF